MDLSNVTRVEVIDEEGRSYTKYGVIKTELVIQDDGQTLKIFLEVDKKDNK